MNFSLHQAESDACYCFFHFIGQNWLWSSSNYKTARRFRGKALNYLISTTLMEDKVEATQERGRSPHEEITPQCKPEGRCIRFLELL